MSFGMTEWEGRAVGERRIRCCVSDKWRDADLQDYCGRRARFRGLPGVAQPRDLTRPTIFSFQKNGRVRSRN
jgi:hypothetical protein